MVPTPPTGFGSTKDYNKSWKKQSQGVGAQGNKVPVPGSSATKDRAEREEEEEEAEAEEEEEEGGAEDGQDGARPAKRQRRAPNKWC